MHAYSGPVVITANNAATATHSAASNSYSLNVTVPQLRDGTKVGDPYQGGVLAFIREYGDWGEFGFNVDHGIVISTSPIGCLPRRRPGGSGYPSFGNQLPGDCGTGKANTAAKVNSWGTSTDYAAGLCDSYTNPDTGTGAYSDWYLPSFDELYMFCLKSWRIGYNNGKSCWTSTAAYIYFSVVYVTFWNKDLDLFDNDSWDAAHDVYAMRNF
jgi:hypothetical protein